MANFERYQRIAPLYDLFDLPFEHRRYRKLRPTLFAGLSGRLLDAGVGTGRNFPFYPPGARVIGIDQSPNMLARARRRLSSSQAAIELRQMDVTRLDFPDDSFDAAVASFLFCVLPDEQQLPAFRELRRVLRPGGRIRIMDYVRPSGALRRLATRLWEPWIHWAYGAGFDGRPEDHARAAGLDIAEMRFVYDDLIRLIELRVRK